jgi:hypothetical protein
LLRVNRDGKYKEKTKRCPWQESIKDHLADIHRPGLPLTFVPEEGTDALRGFLRNISRKRHRLDKLRIIA